MMEVDEGTLAQSSSSRTWKQRNRGPHDPRRFRSGTAASEACFGGGRRPQLCSRFGLNARGSDRATVSAIKWAETGKEKEVGRLGDVQFPRRLRLQREEEIVSEQHLSTYRQHFTHYHNSFYIFTTLSYIVRDDSQIKKWATGIYARAPEPQTGPPISTSGHRRFSYLRTY